MPKMDYCKVENEPLHKEIFRNETIRIYKAVLKPGSETLYHKHSKNTIYITLKGGKVKTLKMASTPSCPTKLCRNIGPLSMIKLIFQRFFSGYLTLWDGFFFYMPSEQYPAIHKAIASRDNKADVELLGIELS